MKQQITPKQYQICMQCSKRDKRCDTIYCYHADNCEYIKELKLKWQSIKGATVVVNASPLPSDADVQSDDIKNTNNQI